MQLFTMIYTIHVKLSSLNCSGSVLYGGREYYASTTVVKLI